MERVPVKGTVEKKTPVEIPEETFSTIPRTTSAAEMPFETHNWECYCGRQPRGIEEEMIEKISLQN